MAMPNLLFSLAIAIVHVTLIDGSSGPPRPNATVVVENDTIVAAGDAATIVVPGGATVIDGTNRFLIPGLFDSHIHLSKTGEGALKLCVANGVTSVRDMGSDIDEVHRWRDEIASGSRVGPRIRTSGPMLESAANVQRMLDEHVVEPVSTIRLPVANPRQAAEAVAMLRKRGADYVKVRTFASRETYFAIADAARAAGLKLVGHANDLTPADLLRSGQKSIEHYLPPGRLPKAEGERRAEFRQLAKAGVAIVPTLVVGRQWLLVPNAQAELIVNDDAGRIDPRRRYISEHLLRDWREQVQERRGEKPVDWEGFARGVIRNDREMHEEGMRFLAGTDAAVALIYPGFGVHDELKELVSVLGFTPMEALLAATRNPAEFLGVDNERGTIATGKRADVVLLDANPLHDIANTSRIAGVMSRGVYYDRAALDKMLADVEDEASSVAITNATVIDVQSGALHPLMTVMIRGNRIVSVAASEPPPKTARIIDGRGKFLIPGLWDMHVHLSWTKSGALPLLIANGVTNVRDVGSKLEEIDAWRTKIGAGLITGPGILRVGPIINGQKFNAYQLVAGNPDETRGIVRALKEAGVDFIKIHRRMPRDSYFAAIDEAKKQGLTVVGHIPMTVTPEEASDAGQVTIEHTQTLFEGTFATAAGKEPLPQAIRRFRTDAANVLFAKFVANGTAVTPTLVAVRTVIEGIEAHESSRPPDPRRKYVPPSLLAEADKLLSGMKAGELEEWKALYAELREVTGQMNRAGVILLAGSDIASARIPGFTLHEELALLVEAGLTPLQALQAATITPARVLHRLADHGTIETGKLADLVLLDANPLTDIHNTQRISAVVVNGRFLDRAKLDALLREAESLAAGR